MSDFTSERIPAGLVGEGRSPARTMAGSLVAGVAAGYFSHIPHNLSTLKLMDPTKSYLKHFQDMAAKNAARVPEGISGGARTATANALTLLAPAAIGVRTTQIVGSFMILNGGIVMLSDFDIREKLGMVRAARICRTGHCTDTLTHAGAEEGKAGGEPSGDGATARIRQSGKAAPQMV